VWQIRIGILPQEQQLLIDLTAGCYLAREGRCAREFKMSKWEQRRNRTPAAVFTNELPQLRVVLLRQSPRPLMCLDICSDAVIAL
jgi:hypothetical protein